MTQSHLRHRFVTIALAVIAAVVAVQFTTPKNGAVDAPRETTFDRVMRTGTLRCGYAIVKEYIIKDDTTGKLSGPAVDIIEAMGKNLNLKVEWAAEAGFATFAEDLRMGRYDMMCTPLTANAARSKVTYFSRPVMGLSTLLWLHKDDPRVGDDLSWANSPDVTMSVVDGTAFTGLMEKHFPKTKILSLPELSPVTDALEAVKTKKADGALMVTMTGEFYSQQNDNILKPASLVPVLVNPGQFPLPQGDERFRTMVDVALGELLFTHVIDKILDKYDASLLGRYWRMPPIIVLPEPPFRS